MVNHLNDDRARRLLSLAIIAAIIVIGIAASRHRPALIPSGPLVSFSPPTLAAE